MPIFIRARAVPIVRTNSATRCFSARSPDDHAQTCRPPDGGSLLESELLARCSNRGGLIIEGTHARKAPGYQQRVRGGAPPRLRPDRAGAASDLGRKRSKSTIAERPLQRITRCRQGCIARRHRSSPLPRLHSETFRSVQNAAGGRLVDTASAGRPRCAWRTTMLAAPSESGLGGLANQHQLFSPTLIAATCWRCPPPRASLSSTEEASDAGNAKVEFS